jgi:hypothetical protein
MTDYQRVVDELRSLLQASDQTDTERLKALAAAYAEECRAANERLRRCEEFLKKGQRAGAIQFAQAEPVLLDVVAALDFPERAHLEEMLLFYGLPAPPRLNLATAEALNQAYAEEQPLEGLLRQHRRLALARAPLPARLEVMRKLAMLDTQNPVWMDDVRTFEQARFRQLQAAVTRASARGEPGPVAAVAGELGQVWFNPPPAALCTEVERLQQQFAQQQGRADLAALAGQLNGAVAANDLGQAQGLRDRFKEVLARSGVSPTDPVARYAEQPLRWVMEQERLQVAELEFQTALAELEAALDARAEPEEAGRLYNAALNHGRDLPDAVEERYRAYVTRAQGARQWREKMILIVVVFVGVAVLLSIVGYLWLRARHNAAAGAARRPAPAAPARREVSWPRGAITFASGGRSSGRSTCSS